MMGGKGSKNSCYNLAMPLKARITVYGVTPVQSISCTVFQAEWDVVNTFFRLSLMPTLMCSGM
jgi:hypothetical protein